MTSSSVCTVQSGGVVAPGAGDHYFFLNHLATVKVVADDSSPGLSIVEFTAPYGFGPPLHSHAEEDEVMYLLQGEIRLGAAHDGGPVISTGATAVLPHGIPHTWQVVSPQARFLTINTGRHRSPSFDRFVAALGTPTDPTALPAPRSIDPVGVATVCGEHGITVLGPPPAIEDARLQFESR